MRQILRESAIFMLLIFGELCLVLLFQYRDVVYNLGMIIAILCVFGSYITIIFRTNQREIVILHTISSIIMAIIYIFLIDDTEILGKILMISIFNIAIFAFILLSSKDIVMNKIFTSKISLISVLSVSLLIFIVMILGSIIFFKNNILNNKNFESGTYRTINPEIISSGEISIFAPGHPVHLDVKKNYLKKYNLEHSNYGSDYDTKNSEHEFNDTEITKYPFISSFSNIIMIYIGTVCSISIFFGIINRSFK